MSLFEKFRDSWVRPALFFGNNPISLTGGAITTASGVTMISYWLAELAGHLSDNPYLGIIFFLILPLIFLLGLSLIPVGVLIRRRKLQKAGQIPAAFPRIDLNDRKFRHGLDIVLVFTIVNFLVVATASYHGAEYMDSPQFCGRSCHVMKPEFTAYQISPHSHVACVDCHIGSGAQAYVNAKINGTKQLIEVTFHPLAPLAPKFIPNYPTPIPSPVTSLRPARYTCEGCHTPTRFDGDKLLVKSNFADDEQNTETQTVLILHLGGVDSLSRYTGIHGVHLGHIEYVSTDSSRTTIPWVERQNSDGSFTEYSSLPAGSGIPKGDRRVMDCIDCHNRAAHTFVTAEQAVDQAMATGAISPNLPWIHKEGLSLLNGTYTSSGTGRHSDPPATSGLLSYAESRRALAECSSGRSGGQGARHALQPECISLYERDLGNPSQSHRSHGLPGLFPLSRRQPHCKERRHHSSGLHSLPQPARRPGSQTQGSR